MNILDNEIHLAHTMSFDELDRRLDLITYNGAKTLNLEDQYGIAEGKPANFLVLDATSPFEAVRQRADVLASIRNGEYLFKRHDPRYEIALISLGRRCEKTATRALEGTRMSDQKQVAFSVLDLASRKDIDQGPAQHYRGR